MHLVRMDSPAAVGHVWVDVSEDVLVPSVTAAVQLSAVESATSQLRS